MTSDEHAGGRILGSLRSADGKGVVRMGGPLRHLLAAFGAGVQVHVEDLAAYLAGRERVDAAARWEELIPAYQDLAANIS